jgi:hypothetical protein
MKVELGQQIPDVGLHRRLTRDQLGGDLGVGQAAREQPEDLELPGGQPAQPARWADAGRGRRTNSSISRRVIEGARSASPPATTWIAAINCSGGASLSRSRWHPR